MEKVFLFKFIISKEKKNHTVEELNNGIFAPFKKYLNEKYSVHNDFYYRDLCCYYLLTKTLEKSGIDLSKLDFIVGEYGKPDFKNHIHFNISHSSDLLVIALYKDEIGVDIEFKDRIKEKFSKYILGKKETEEYNQAGIDKEDYLLKTWTNKEAQGKYLGKGISIKSLRFDRDGPIYQRFDSFKTKRISISICTGKILSSELVVLSDF